MKKTVLNFFVLALILIANTSGFAQKLITKTGNIKFQASMPSYEEVAAENKSVSAVLEQSTGDFAALVLIKGFRFKVALMEEHFNENYMDLTIHGKTKPVTVIVKISKAANGVNAVGSFEAKPEDFDIEIPSLVRKKIADKIKINYNFLLTK
jgi:hypothetical protein